MHTSAGRNKGTHDFLGSEHLMGGERIKGVHRATMPITIHEPIARFEQSSSERQRDRGTGSRQRPVDHDASQASQR